MKKILLSLAVLALGANVMNAEEIVLNVNDATGIDGTLVEEVNTDAKKAAKHYQPLNSLKIGDWSFSFQQGANESNAPAYYYPMSTGTSTKNSVRVYKDNTATITAPAGVMFVKVVAVADNSNTPFTIYSGEAVS